MQGFTSDKAPASLVSYTVKAGEIETLPAAEGADAAAAPKTRRQFAFTAGAGGAPAKINYSSLAESLVKASNAAGVSLVAAQVNARPAEAEGWTPNRKSVMRNGS